MAIDERIEPLVHALNQLPAVQTVASCGGHEGPTGEQVPEGQFSISVDVERTQAGWRSLEWIVWAVWQVDPERMDVVAWPVGDKPESMVFGVVGHPGADPGGLANALVQRTERG